MHYKVAEGLTGSYFVIMSLEFIKIKKQAIEVRIFFSHAKWKLQKYLEHLAGLLVSSNINQFSVISVEFMSVDNKDDNLQRKFMPACEQKEGSISYTFTETANFSYVFLILYF